MEGISFVDTHSHLSMLTHDSIENILSRASEAHLEKLITVSTEESNWSANQELAEKYDSIYYTLGMHPHETSRFVQCASELLSLFPDQKAPSKCVAIGEIGLDFYYSHAPKDLQISAFEMQLELAKKVQLPVVIHCREAFADLFPVLERVNSPYAGVMHCFTGTTEEAQKSLDLGFYISFSGIVTFKNAEPLRETAKTIPLNRLLIETDCPFLAPLPHRGKPNEPSYLPLTASCLATVRGSSLEEIARSTFQNAVELFQLQTE